MLPYSLTAALADKIVVLTLLCDATRCIIIILLISGRKSRHYDILSTCYRSTPKIFALSTHPLCSLLCSIIIHAIKLFEFLM